MTTTRTDRDRATRRVLLAAALVSVAGCGAADEGSVMAQMRTFKNRMCDCRDTACTTKVEGDYQAWLDKVGREAAGAKPRAETLAELKRLENTMEACWKAMNEGGEASGKLEVKALDPTRGAADGGQLVIISGHGFTSSTRNAKVYFGDHPANVVRFRSDDELIVEAPGGAPGSSVNVLVVFEPGGEFTLPAAFRYE